MRADRVVVAGTVVLFVGTAVAAGPLVGLPLLEPEPADPGTGSVSATVADTPTRVTLEATDFGAGYDLRGPPVTVTLSEVAGRPYLSYTVAVPALGHQTTSLTVVEADGRIRLTMNPSTLSEGAVDADSYEGRLAIHAIDDDGRRVVAETEVTVEVRE